ncbi:hypothetical protein GCM10027047_25490 [Rhodococcus aerolatus]
MLLTQAADTAGLTGLTGFVADLMTTLGEVGVGALTLAETVFPPIPSEVVLPLAGYLSARGDLSLVGVLVLATVGSVLGALGLYWAGAALGYERATRLLARLPLLDREDVDAAADWFHRHGPSAVLIGRLVPGVRSLVSLPAGAERMPVLRFTLLTTLGSLAWNALLVLAGAALGTQYELVERYAGWLNTAVYAAAGAFVVWLVVRRVRKARAARVG